MRHFPRARPSERLPLLLLALLTATWLLLAIDPVSREDWLLENILVLLTVPVLVLNTRQLSRQ